MGLVMGGILGVTAIIAVTRFGLVALAAFYFTWMFLQEAPALLRPSAWYSGAFGVVLAVAGWALYVAITPFRHRAGRHSMHVAASRPQSSS